MHTTCDQDPLAAGWQPCFHVVRYKSMKYKDLNYLVKKGSIRRKCRKSSLFCLSGRFVHRVIHSFCGKLENPAIATTCRIFQQNVTKMTRKFRFPVTPGKPALSSAISVLCTASFQKCLRPFFCYPVHRIQSVFSSKSLIFRLSLFRGQGLPNLKRLAAERQMAAVSGRLCTELSTGFVDNRVCRL